VYLHSRRRLATLSNILTENNGNFVAFFSIPLSFLSFPCLTNHAGYFPVGKTMSILELSQRDLFNYFSIKHDSCYRFPSRFSQQITYIFLVL
jgi:hypothetical protein